LKKEIFVPSGYLVYEQFHALNNDFSFARYFIDEAKFQELKGFEVNQVTSLLVVQAFI
jgi:type I restriction enzyme S subunit